MSGPDRRRNEVAGDLGLQRRRPRRKLSHKQEQHLFYGFDRWGWDEKSWSQRTRLSYGYRVKATNDWLKANENVSVFFAKTRHLKTYLFQTSPKARNRNNIRQALVGFYEFLNHLQMREDNPAISLPILKEPRSIPKALDAEVIQRILQAARAFGAREVALMHCLAFTGLRRSGVRCLEWWSLDEQPGWLRVRVKNDKDLVLPVHPDLAQALRTWRVTNKHPRWVFPSPMYAEKPISETTFNRIVREVGEMAGVEGLHPHLMRHSFATELLEEGVDLRTVQEALAHSSLSTTAQYLKVRPAKLKDGMGKLNYKRKSPDPDSAA